MIAPAVLAQLAATGGVTDLVGDRIYPEYDRRADRMYPLCVYKVQNVTPTQTNTGNAGLESADFTIAVVTTRYGATDTLARAIVGALDSQKGTWGGVTVQGCFLKDDGIEDDVVTNPDTEEILFYVKQLTFQVFYAT